MKLKRMRKIVALIVLCTIFQLPVLEDNTMRLYATGDTELYVHPVIGKDTINDGSENEPFRTIQKAKERVRELIADGLNGNIVVYLREGRYEISETMVFDESDSGSSSNKVIYRNYPNEEPVLDGGVILDNWSDPDGDGIYKTQVTPGFKFRQLYVNGERAIRSREPETTDTPDYDNLRWYRDDQKVRLKKSDFPYPSTWENENEIEIVTYRSFKQGRFRVGNVVEANSNYVFVIPREPDRSELFNTRPFGSGDVPFYLENAFEFIDSEREWYLNTSTNTLYYKPALNEDMTNIQIIAPKTETIIELNGAHDIWFYGLRIENSTWLRPSYAGNMQRQGGLYNDQLNNPTVNSLGTEINQVVKSAILMKRCHDILFQRNIFRNLGGNGINYDEGTYNNQIVGNVFYKMADTAIVIGIDQEPNPGNDPVTGLSLRNRNELIANNYIYDLGVDYSGSAAIFESNSADNLTIVHNEIAQSHNLAMNFGWTSAGDSTTGLVIAYNDIHHIGMRHVDNGGIHFRDGHADAILYENYFHDIKGEPGFSLAATYDRGAIFLDGSACGTHIEHNVFDNNERNYNVNSKAYNNVFKNNETNDQSVIDNAGLETQYEDIKGYINDGVIGVGSPSLESFDMIRAQMPVKYGESLPFMDHFNNETTGQNISNYDTVALYGGSVKAQQISSNDLSMELRSTYGDRSRDNVIASKYIEEKTDGTISFQARVKPSQTNSRLYVEFAGDLRPAATILFNDNGYIQTRTFKYNTEHQNIQTYSANTWYTIKIVADISNQTYDVYIDDMYNKKMSNVPFGEDWFDANTVGIVDEINQIRFDIRNGEGIFLIDDVIVEEVEDIPSIVSLVANWEFENNTVESVMNNNAILNGGVSFDSTNQVQGNYALSLDGIDGYLDASISVSQLPLGNSSRTITGWFKANSNSTSMSFLNYGTNNAGGRVSITANNDSVAVAVGGCNYGKTNLNLTDGWHHLAIVFPDNASQSDEWKIYVDGQELSGLTILAGVVRTVNTMPTDNTCYIGKVFDSQIVYNGLIDDIRVYHGELTQSQIQELAN